MKIWKAQRPPEGDAWVLQAVMAAIPACWLYVGALALLAFGSGGWTWFP
jgi:hypothetical protein